MHRKSLLPRGFLARANLPMSWRPERTLSKFHPFFSDGPRTDHTVHRFHRDDRDGETDAPPRGLNLPILADEKKTLFDGSMNPDDFLVTVECRCREKVRLLIKNERGIM
jgi:hypothetical protein